MSSQAFHNDSELHHAEISPYAERVQALELLLIEKGVLTQSEFKKMLSAADLRSPADGARVVAHAWTDAGYKDRLLNNAKAAVTELGYEVTGEMPELIAVENTEEEHYLIVCTLCSCYPRWLLGRPPDWYKSLSYRARAVEDPRGVIREFGCDLNPAVKVRVVDSTADVRYIVLPRRPAGTENLNEIELAALVTRDSMIGVGLALEPHPITESS